MIISVNQSAQNAAFEDLLNETLDYLTEDAGKKERYYLGREGSKLERDIFNVMCETARGTDFDNSIELISGQKFPDIIAKKYYGVEVKTTTKNHWRTTGNSVLESTRVEGVERIYLMFGKLASPVEFRVRKYEECLTEVVVTHSPRYLIDMNTASGETIFDKMKIPYDILRRRENPLTPVVDYYRSQLKEGEDVWWIGKEKEQEEVAANFSIRLWHNLDPRQKKALQNQAMALFPEMFGKSTRKYSKPAVWLVMEHGITATNVRDAFSAGGKGDIDICGRIYKKQPKIFQHLFENLAVITEFILREDPVRLSRYWGRKAPSGADRISTWASLVQQYATDNHRMRIDILNELERVALAVSSG
jgi:hypothetical protein